MLKKSFLEPDLFKKLEQTNDLFNQKKIIEEKFGKPITSGFTRFVWILPEYVLKLAKKKKQFHKIKVKFICINVWVQNILQKYWILTKKITIGSLWKK